MASLDLERVFSSAILINLRCSRTQYPKPSRFRLYKRPRNTHCVSSFLFANASLDLFRFAGSHKEKL